MKTVLKIIIVFGLVLNINAQSIERTYFKISLMDKTQNTLKLDNKLKVIDGFNITGLPQFGNLFMNRMDAKKANINWKDFYNDFDLGMNIGFNYSLKKHLYLKALYNIGLLKFDVQDTLKSDGYFFKLSLHYSF